MWSVRTLPSGRCAGWRRIGRMPSMNEPNPSVTAGWPPARRLRRGLVGTAVAVVLVAAASVLGTGPASAAPADGALAPYTRQSVHWKRCPDQEDAALKCATIKVPLDYRKPRGRTIRLAISRIATSVHAKHRGILLFNPGGPGGGGLEMPTYMRRELPRSVTEQFDLIGFDPRGVGASTPVTCGLANGDPVLSGPYRPATFREDVAKARAVARKCARHAGVLAHITTRNTARDMDVIRAVLGEKKLSYLGYSYGTYLGAVYTQLFPGRAWAVGSKPAFDRFTSWTAARDATYHLGATPDAVAGTFWGIVRLADSKPVDGMNGDSIREIFRYEVFSPKDAAEQLVSLKNAAQGKPADPALAPLRREVPRNRFAVPADDNGDAVFLSIICNDVTNWPRDPEQYRRDAIRDKELYPLAGDMTSNITPCAFWSIPHTETSSTVRNSTGALVVQNEWDSQTPSFTGIGLHRALRGSRLVFVAGGEGHGVYSKQGDKCAYAAVNAYLTTGRLPARDVTCRAAPSA
jgi:pimeloyl-ACP methyl ester carboxylesterase